MGTVSLKIMNVKYLTSSTVLCGTDNSVTLAKIVTFRYVNTARLYVVKSNIYLFVVQNELKTNIKIIRIT